MKLFHLSDLHIGLRLYNYDLSEDQRYVFRQILDAAREEKPDAVVIAGDIYDRSAPPAEAVTLFNDFLNGLRDAVPDAAILIISGNHDSAARIDCYRRILSRENLYVIGEPPRREGENIECVELFDEFGPVRFYLLPFVKPSVVKQAVDSDEDSSPLSYDEAVRRLIGALRVDSSIRNVLVSHQFYVPEGQSAADVERSDSEVITVGNIDSVSADVLRPFDYAALGHIHRPMCVGRANWRYCGTPMPYSLSESKQKKGIQVVTLGRKKDGVTDLEMRMLPLRALHDVREIQGTLEDVLRQPSEDYVSVLLSDPDDLDVFDLQNRLRSAFPNLIDIRRKACRSDHEEEEYQGDKEEPQDPLTLCRSFLGEMSPEQETLLQDIIKDVQEKEGGGAS